MQSRNTHFSNVLCTSGFIVVPDFEGMAGGKNREVEKQPLIFLLFKFLFMISVVQCKK